MAAFNIDPNISLGIKPQPALSLGDVMNIARGAQAYKQAEQYNPLLIREQAAQTELAEKTLNPKIEQQAAITKEATLKAEQTGVDVKNHYSNVARSILGGLATDPDFVKGNGEAMAKKIQGSKEYAEKVLGLPADVVAQVDPLIEMAKTNPREAMQAIKNGILQGQTLQTQQATVTPQVTTDIYGRHIGVVGATGQMGIMGENNPELNPKSTLGTYSKDIYGNPVFIPNTPQGGIGTPQYPGQPPQQGATTPQVVLPPGETSTTLQEVQGIRTEANRAAKAVPQLQYNANQIIKLADETNPGRSSDMLRTIQGGVSGILWSSDEATNYDKLGHYIAQNSITLAQQAGLGTDAGRHLQEQASGSTRFTKDSLKSVARTNRALTSGVSLYNQGIENAIAKSGSPFAARTFQNEWSKTADVNVFRLYDAIKNNDNYAIKEVVKDAGGPKSKGYKDLVERAQKLKTLIEGNQ